MRTVGIQLGTMQLPHRLPFSSHSKALRLKSEKTRFTVYTALMETTFLVIKKKKLCPPPHVPLCLSLKVCHFPLQTESQWLEGTSGDHPEQTPC